MSATAQEADAEFRDPAPPKLEPLAEVEPPKPTAHPDVTFHRAPAPLDPKAVAGDWPGFPGAARRPVSAETLLRRDWGESGPALVWELAAGEGYASPAVHGGRLFYFHRVGDEEVLECLHAETGERFWSFGSPTDYRDTYGYGNGPRCTPVVDGDRIYSYGAQGKLHCLKAETGQLVWKRDLSAEFGVEQDFFGVVSTPVIFEDHLIIHLGAPKGPCVLSLDKHTGRVRWASSGEWTAGYSTPLLGQVHGEDKCFVFAGGKSRPPSGGLICLDPRDGSVDFTFPWRSRSYESVNASMPLLIGERVFVSASYDTGGALLDLKPAGGFEVAWTSKALGTHFNTAIHRDGYLYGFDGRNEPDASLVCQELATGEEVWRTVLEWEDTYERYGSVKARPAGVYRGTLLAVDGDYLCLGERGHLLWLDLSPEGCREVARTWLFGAYESWTPLAISRGLLYVCQNTRDFVSGAGPRLLCYDLRRSE
ncbi:MAG: PQQ-binding-like beta-propeller repeat protein [Planctomycetota bacterium]